MLKIYIASSWRNEKAARELAEYLRDQGFEVDCFCDPSTGRDILRRIDYEHELKSLDAIEFIKDHRVEKIYMVNKYEIKLKDVCILLLPSGKSCHLEAGYAKGNGKKLFIYGDFPKGEVEAMYLFADGIFRREELNKMTQTLIEEEIRIHRDKIGKPVLANE